MDAEKQSIEIDDDQEHSNEHQSAQLIEIVESTNNVDNAGTEGKEENNGKQNTKHCDGPIPRTFVQSLILSFQSHRYYC